MKRERERERDVFLDPQYYYEELNSQLKVVENNRM